MLGITITDPETDIERTIYRLTTRLALADAAVKGLVDDELHHGETVARRNIQQYVYAVPQGPNTHYKRTYDLLNSVRSGVIHSQGAVAAGQVYISRAAFHRVYYPVFVDQGYDAGAPYEGRHFWGVTIAELRMDTRKKAIAAGKMIARGEGLTR